MKASSLRTLDELINEVGAFFANDKGIAESSLQGMSLLEIACLGNAEKTLQGELFYHLRSLNWNVVLELGYLHAPGVRRNPDIGVFDSFSTQKKLICVIELKHYSANQGSATQLTKALDSDHDLDRPPVPLMQIGLYTTVAGVSPPLGGRFENGIYRFLNTYCGGNLPPVHVGKALFSDWANGKNWLEEPLIGATGLTSFVDESSRTISGHIEYIVGIRH